MSNPHPTGGKHADACKCPACRRRTGRLKHYLSLCIEPELDAWVRAEAERQGRTVTAVIERGLIKLKEERKVKVKTTVSNERTLTTLAHPEAEVGNFNDAALQIREIIGVPEGMDAAEVVRLFDQTIVCEYHDEPMLVIPFEELGAGRIVKAPGYGKR